MTVYTAQCRHDADQSLKASQNGVSVIFDAYADDENVTSPYLSPADARTFARGILALADEVDGGEKAEVTTGLMPKLGDKFRLTRHSLNFAGVSVGDVVTVTELHPAVHEGHIDGFRVRGDDDRNWWFDVDHIGNGLEATTGEPVIDTSKIVVLDDPAPSRAALLEQAADLMINSQTYTATDLTELADYLAGEK
jgi:hypothetical protein